MRRILLTGGSGQIGWELQRSLAGLAEVVAPGRARMDLARPDSIRDAIREARPDVIVNAAAFSSMDRSEAEPELAQRVNGVAPGIMGEEARRLGALLLHYSSAYVFDGEAGDPYREDHPPSPINAYGRSKLAGEQAVTASGCAHLILRLSWVHSLRGANFLTAILKLAAERPELPVVDDQIGSPTWARSIAEATGQVLERWRSADGPAGIFHLSAAGMVSRYGFAREIVAASAAPRPVVRPVPSTDYRLPAARPRYCVLDNSRLQRAFGIALPDWREQVRACLNAAEPAPSMRSS